jgi:hypothetical protein
VATDIQALAQIDYTARDFVGYQAALFDFATRVFPEWTSRSPGDFGVLFVEQMAYIGDIMSFYQDAIANETFLLTATQRDSVVAIAQQLGYTPQIATPAAGTVTLATTSTQTSPVTVPPHTQLITAFNSSLDRAITFETTAAVTVPATGGTATANVVEGATQGGRTVVGYGASATDPGVSQVEDVGVSNGQPFQSFNLAVGPVIFASVRVFVETPIPSGGAMVAEWLYVDTWLRSGPDDQVFRLTVSDSGQATVFFGDGINGAIPPSGLNIAIGYRTGGGSYGNLAANSLIDFAGNVTGVVISASSAMTGGADLESLASIRANAPRVFRTQDRAVSTADYGDLALSVAGVSSAYAVATNQASVTVYCLGPTNTVPSQTTLDLVQKTLALKSLGGVAITVLAGTTIPVNLGSNSDPTLNVQLYVNPRFKRGQVQLAAYQAIQTLLSADFTTFAMRFSVSNVYATLEGVPGVNSSLVPVMARNDSAQTGNADVVFRAWEVPVLGNVYINTIGGAV